MTGSLEGRNALVSGGSRGIGKAIALRLAKQGAAVGINYRRDEDAAFKTLEEIESAGGKAVVCQADVRVFEQCAELVDCVRQRIGVIDILINNAGVASRGMSVVDTDPEELPHVLYSNAISAAYLSKLVVPGMRSLDRGDVIAISASVTRGYGAQGAPVNMAKAALEAFAFTLAAEERQYGIRVNVVAPGLVETESGRRLVRATAGIRDMRELDASSPFGAVCQPSDVAKVVHFLVSDDNKYISGERIYCDAGVSRRDSRFGNSSR